MKERPILSNSADVRAILDGRKTMLRQIVKITHRTPGLAACLEPAVGAPRPRVAAELCPYGQPGDRLYVRETTVNVEDHGYIGPVYLESDEGRSIMDWGLAPAPDDCTEVEPYELKLRPSARMPKSMARIWLEVIGVRVEKPQDISEADALAEGIRRQETTGWFSVPGLNGAGITARAAYALLWNRIHGPGSWDANPWVWAIEFRRVS